MKYARVERERRYLLRSFPTRLAVRRKVEIHDRYVRGTALRLRLAQEGHEEPLPRTVASPAATLAATSATELKTLLARYGIEI
jgi:hypothetical protein